MFLQQKVYIYSSTEIYCPEQPSLNTVDFYHADLWDCLFSLTCVGERSLPMNHNLDWWVTEESSVFLCVPPSCATAAPSQNSSKAWSCAASVCRNPSSHTSYTAPSWWDGLLHSSWSGMQNIITQHKCVVCATQIWIAPAPIHTNAFSLWGVNAVCLLI